MSNCIVAQSGGPTSVINSSVVGIIQANKDLKIFDNIYGGINGIEGILENQIISLSEYDPKDIMDFKYTPSSGLGSCRYKMKDISESTEEYDKLTKILNELNITTFFYIGGNDSMDTTAKLGKYSKDNNLGINFIGIPKTIDNDLICTDHTPGFGSAAKFISTSVLETYLDSSVYKNNGIFILETMGRDTGWLAASACAARYFGNAVADFIYLPEKPFNVEKFLSDVKTTFDKKNQVYIVVSEGLKDMDNNFISTTECSKNDNFSHHQLGGVGNVLKEHILDAGITSRVKVLELGVLQRCAMHCASTTDVEEAFRAGYEALKYSSDGNNGCMVAITRTTNFPYTVTYSLAEAKNVANNVKYFPSEWINEEGNHVTKEAYQYIKPLIDGTPKYKIFTK